MEPLFTHDDEQLIAACALETSFSSLARAHDRAIDKALEAYAEQEKATDVHDKEILREKALHRSRMAEVIKLLMLSKFPEAAAEWFK